MKTRIFSFNNVSNRVEINEYEILLVREFKKIWERDKSKDKEKAYREFTYMWLMRDWLSPYCDYTDMERHEEAKLDAELTELEWNDPDFRAMVRKYENLQESARPLKLIRAAEGMVDKFIDYFDTVDPNERDELTKKPLYKVKDMMAEVKQISGLIEELEELERLYKRQISAESDVRGDADPGLFD